MAFVNLSLLFGGMLAAIPILLHLAMRRQPKRIEFPALRFIQQRSEANRRQLQVRHWLLLLLRCLAVAALAAALARPSVASAQLGDWAAMGLLGSMLLVVLLLAAAAWRLRKGRLLVGLLGTAALALLVGLTAMAVSGAGGERRTPTGDQEAPVSAVFVFDASPRMDYRKANQTRLEQAQEIAQWLIRQLPPDSEVAVVDSRLRQSVFAVDLAAAAKSVQQMRTTGAPRPFGRVLQQAMELAAGSSARHKVREIYVFTDLAKRAWEGQSAESLANRIGGPGQSLLYVIDVGVEEPQNFALGDLRLSGQVLVKSSDFSVDTDVTATGGGGQRIVELLLEAPDPRRPMIRDGHTLLPELQPRGRQACTLPANGSQSVQFHVQGGLSVGVHQGQVRLTGADGLASDDVRYFTVEVREPWPVLLAAPAGVAAKFLLEAIAPYEFRQTGRARFRCDVIDQGRFADQPLSAYAAVCLLDPEPLDANQWRNLAEYVHEGGGLAVFLGHNANPERSFQEPAVQQLLGGRLARQWRAGGDDLHLAPSGLDHPLLRVFRPMATSVPWDRYPVFRHWVLAPLTANAQVIMPYANGKPALVEQPWGRGRVLTMTTPVSDPARPEGREPWNELVAGEDSWPCFVLVNEIMLYLAASGDARLNYQTGETAVLASGEESDPQRYQLFTPSEEPQDLTASRGVVTVRFTESPGAYRLKGYRGGPVVRGFSANLPAEASDLTRTTPKQLEAILGQGRFQLARNRDEIVFGVRQARAGREFYPLLMTMFALTLGLEQLLANRFYRRQEPASVT